jgi:hypothetical protein
MEDLTTPMYAAAYFAPNTLRTASRYLKPFTVSGSK